MKYSQMTKIMRWVNDKNLGPVNGYIVFTEDSCKEKFCEKSRTYIVSSNNKAWIADMGGYSIFGTCLDGTDNGIRLDYLMKEEVGNQWRVEECYFLDGEERISDMDDAKILIKYQNQMHEKALNAIKRIRNAAAYNRDDFDDFDTDIAVDVESAVSIIEDVFHVSEP